MYLDNLFLNLIFKSLNSGQGNIQIENAKVFLNDSEASDAKVKISNLNLEIQKNPSVASQGQKLVLDFLPPDEFKIYLSKDRNVFDNSLFLSFNAQDKGSGINRYEVREKFLGIWGDWKIGESPYPLSDKLSLSIIEVKAVDNVGRERETLFVPFRLYLLYGGLVILLIIFLIIKIIKRIKT